MGRGKNVINFRPKGEASQIIFNSGTSFIYTDNDIKSIVKNINNDLGNILDIKANLMKQGQNNREYIINNFCRNTLSEKYRKILNELS